MSEDTKVVGAIDFGTTYSGWAFLFEDGFKNEPTNPFVRHWPCGRHMVEKTPTCILVNPDGITAAAYGYDAENQYIKLAERGEHEEFYFFKQFKMKLSKKFGEKLDRDFQLEDVRDRTLPALDVFAMSIKYLLDDMLTVLNSRNKGSAISLNNILLVLTVPALWTDGAKMFMREAAVKAGCISSNVLLVLEPEVASVYCQLLPGHQTVDGRFMQFPLGSRFLVLDAGGGTVDIAVHEVEEDFLVKEVATASGGDWGGTMVDDAFRGFMKELFGEDIYNSMKTEHTADLLELMRDFENHKTMLDPDLNHKVHLRFPDSLMHLLGIKFKEGFSKHVKLSKFSAGASFINHDLILTPNLCRSFYEEAVHKTVSLIEQHLTGSKVGKVRAILMVGGFSQSKVLQHAVKSAFPNLHITIPKESKVSIVKGAVIYGHHPMSISERVLKYTYGIEVMQKFTPGVHSESKKVKTITGLYCKQVFSKHAEKDQVVRVGETQTERRYTSSDSNKNTAELKLFASSIKNPKYTDDMCTCIGQVSIDLDDHDGESNRGIWVSFTFGGPEITVSVYDEKTGKTRTARTDFLGPSLI